MNDPSKSPSIHSSGSDHAPNFSTIHAAQTGRRVLEAVAERLRLRALDLLVAGAGLAPLEQRGERGLLALGERLPVASAAGR